MNEGMVSRCTGVGRRGNFWVMRKIINMKVNYDLSCWGQKSLAGPPKV